MPPTNPVTVLLGRFEDLLARGLRELIEGDPSLQLLASGVEHHRLGVVLRGHRPAVAILDFSSLERPAEVRSLSSEHPQTRLILLTNSLSREECAQLLAFGACACLGRETQSRDVLNAIHLASRGMQITPKAQAGEASYAAGQLLTRREAEVLPLLQRGSSNAQIALALGVSVETVRTHARNIYRKLGVSSRRELAPPASPAPVAAVVRAPALDEFAGAQIRLRRAAPGDSATIGYTPEERGN